MNRTNQSQRHNSIHVKRLPKKEPGKNLVKTVDKGIIEIAEDKIEDILNQIEDICESTKETSKRVSDELKRQWDDIEDAIEDHVDRLEDTGKLKLHLAKMKAGDLIQKSKDNADRINTILDRHHTKFRWKTAEALQRLTTACLALTNRLAD